MKNTAHDHMVRGFARIASKERAKSFRPVITRGRHLDQLDWSQLTVKSSETLCDTDGVFWFIAGFSIIGGDDKVKP